MAVHVDALMPSALAARLEGAVLVQRGSRGVVIRAHDPVLDRDVIVKLVAPGATGATGAGGFAGAGRFAGAPDAGVAEARLQARLAGVRGVCPLLDAGRTDEGWTYLVLPFQANGSLGDRLPDRPASPSVAAAIGASIAEVLASVHEAGLVHGDLKPSNVLVGDDGHVLLADFGSAAPVDRDVTLSDSAGLLGTLAYCAPERLLGDAPSPMADVYALGLTVAALVTGHSPQLVPGEPPLAFLERLSSGEGPELSNLGLPPALCSTLQAMCARDPAARPDAAGAAEALRSFAPGPVRVDGPLPTPSSTPVPDPPWKGLRTGRRTRPPGRGADGRRLVGTLRVGVVVLLAALAGGAFGYSMADGEVDRQSLTFCRAYGELSNSASELVMGARDRFRGAPSIGVALDTMLNDLPRRYAAAYQRFRGRSADFPPSIRDDLAVAAPFVARIEMADYLAHLDGSAVFDEKRRARLERLPEALRGPASAYAGVDRLATTTCGLPDSAFPGMKEDLVEAIAASLTSDGAAFFGDPGNARLIPADAAELAPDMAPGFLDTLAGAFPSFLVALLDQRPEVASVLVARHAAFLVGVVESASGRGAALGGSPWLVDLRRTVVDPALQARLDAALQPPAAS